MDLATARAIAAADLKSALDEIGIAPGWQRGDDIRAAALVAPLAPPLGEPDRKSANGGFQNQVVGRIAERVFNRDWLEPLRVAGLTVVPYHEGGENRDFGVQRDSLELRSMSKSQARCSGRRSSSIPPSRIYHGQVSG